MNEPWKMDSRCGVTHHYKMFIDPVRVIAVEYGDGVDKRTLSRPSPTYTPRKYLSPAQCDIIRKMYHARRSFADIADAVKHPEHLVRLKCQRMGLRSRPVLSEKQKSRIVDLLNEGNTLAQTVRILGVSRGMVENFRNKLASASREKI
jgi:DNA-binding CsgD family transcriptional regulator